MIASLNVLASMLPYVQVTLLFTLDILAILSLIKPTQAAL
jgi:hypothetical protein